MDKLNFLYHYNITLPNRINPKGKKIRGVKPIIYETYYEYNFEDALTFLDAFDINISELYQENNNPIFTDYIYRGHKDSTWELLPSIYRKGINETEQEYSGRINIYKSGNGNLHGKEVTAFVDFIKGMDSLGFDITDESFDLININNKISNFNGTNYRIHESQSFPKKEQLSELALAQHYGVKTRLLDFTENPLIAIFFASESCFPFEKLNKENTKRIGIWVIPKLLIEAIKHIRYIEYIDVKKFQNEYIRAQKGVFINYFPPVNNLIGNVKNIEKSTFLDITYTLDKLLSDKYNNEFLDKLIIEHIGKPMLFTLPHNELEPIAKKLNQLNINWVTLMPSLDGVQKEVERQKSKPYSNLI
ncbi:FRG domain-containing protein [Flavobacterium sp. U410]